MLYKLAVEAIAVVCFVFFMTAFAGSIPFENCKDSGECIAQCAGVGYTCRSFRFRGWLQKPNVYCKTCLDISGRKFITASILTIHVHVLFALCVCEN